MKTVEEILPFDFQLIKNIAVYASCVGKHRIILPLEKKIGHFLQEKKKLAQESCIVSPSSFFLLIPETYQEDPRESVEFPSLVLGYSKTLLFGIYMGVWIFIRYGLCPNA